MKKRILSIFLILLTVLGLTVSALPIWGETLEDSLHDPNMERVKDNADDTVIVLYCGSLSYCLEKNMTVYDFLDAVPNILYAKRYMVISGEGEDRQIIYKRIPRTSDEVRYESSGMSDYPRDDWSSLVDYVLQPEALFDDSVVVQEIYCVDEMPQSCQIYYVTDQGDYVLFKTESTAEDSYLFPLEEYLVFSADYREMNRAQSVDENGEPLSGGSGGSGELPYDIEQYNVKNLHLNAAISPALPKWVIPTAIVAGVAVLGTAIVWAVASKKKSRRASM